MRNRGMMLAAAAMLLAGCGEGEQKPAEPVVPVAFPAGSWELDATVESVTSTDGSSPATDAKPGDRIARKACIAKPEDLAGLFTAEGSDCTSLSDYARQGRINTAYKCAARGGFISPMANGRYTANSFEVTLDTATMFSGSGDYQLRAKATGRRLGDC